METIFILTIWVCRSFNPFCTMDQDPSGPPTNYEYHSYLMCEEAMAKNQMEVIKHFGFDPSSPKESLPRHTCMIKGQDL